MLRNAMRRVSVVVFPCILLAACAATKLTTTWVDESRLGKPVSNVLVIGVTDREAVRRSFESKFVKQLEAAGVKAFSSADVLSIPADKKLAKEEIMAAVNKVNADAVIVTRLIGVNKEEAYNPPVTYYRNYYGYYGYGYDYIQQPGYYSTYTLVLLETNLYDAKSEKLIWSGQSETWNPESEKQISDEVIGAITKDLREKGLI